jgi:hypothetical protein
MPITGTSYDFYAPFMRAVHIDADGNQTPLWVDWANKQGIGSRIAPSDPTNILWRANGVPYVTEISVENNLGDVPRISVRMEPPYEEGIAILNSTLVEFANSFIEVRMGYVNTDNNQVVTGPTWRGFTVQPQIAIGPRISITLNAQGVGGFSMLRTASQNTFQGSNHTFETILQLLFDRHKKVARDSKLSLDFSRINDSSDPAAKAAKAKLKAPVAFWSGGDRTDWEAMWQIAKECNCWLSFEGATLYISARNERLAGEPKAILQVYNFNGGRLGLIPTSGPGNDSSYIFPIMEVSSPTVAAYLPRAQGLASSGYSLTRFDPTTGALSPPTTIDAKTGVSTGTGSPVKAAVTGSDALPKEPVEVHVANAQAAAIAQNEYDRARTSMGINLEITTLGIPDLSPGDVINVRGLGGRISGDKVGNYGVFTVTHTAGASGLSTSLTAWSNTQALFKRSDTQSGTSTNDNSGSGTGGSSDHAAKIMNDKSGSGTSGSSTVKVMPEEESVEVVEFRLKVGERATLPKGKVVRLLPGQGYYPATRTVIQVADGSPPVTSGTVVTGP